MINSENPSPSLDVSQLQILIDGFVPATSARSPEKPRDLNERETFQAQSHAGKCYPARRLGSHDQEWGIILLSDNRVWLTNHVSPRYLVQMLERELP
ncbi:MULTISPECIES: hypothetical protein [unclassified Mesorhizobium]|uniref:hypothetical protein n=1 Tax=unclassified Mesorhizobium TaxID=325217 RepID=UPI000FC9EDE1|nr:MULTISPECIES: hypothetical protein [unclassified Mesorhizobium]RUX94088.1 hypothetical protein EN993_17035 [Mesorhizobium sp. M7D.F.Ca.US.004.01.2.1]RVA24508.1 hypothetical protein EN935_25970 [Mesorhizobium sp. M7D.F.Ca.US.004.03.1.1]